MVSSILHLWPSICALVVEAKHLMVQWGWTDFDSTLARWSGFLFLISKDSTDKPSQSLNEVALLWITAVHNLGFLLESWLLLNEQVAAMARGPSHGFFLRTSCAFSSTGKPCSCFSHELLQCTLSWVALEDHLQYGNCPERHAMHIVGFSTFTPIVQTAKPTGIFQLQFSSPLSVTWNRFRYQWDFLSLMKTACLSRT